MVIVTLSVVLLAFLNIGSSDIGIFYIALMITIVVASFSVSMAYMVIPSSSAVQKDLSSSSLRISLSLTAPIVVALLVVPQSVLSLIGPEYESAVPVLFVLAIAIIPASISINMISMLNNLKKSKMLIVSGLLQFAIFFISFYLLVPQYGIMGAAISFLLAYSGCSLFLIIFTEHASFKYIVFACLSVLAGFTMGYILSMFIGDEQQFLIAISSVAISIIFIFTSKNLTVTETKFLLKEMLQRK